MDSSAAFTLKDMKPHEIIDLAEQFLVQYYTVMNISPHNLHRFYQDVSSLVYEGMLIYGQKQIHEQFMKIFYHNNMCKETFVHVLRMDALRASENSVLIQVAGEMSSDAVNWRRFMQTFLLCELTSRDFFVMNDIFRFHDTAYGDASFNIDNKIAQKEKKSTTLNLPMENAAHIENGHHIEHRQTPPQPPINERKSPAKPEPPKEAVQAQPAPKKTAPEPRAPKREVQAPLQTQPTPAPAPAEPAGQKSWAQMAMNTSSSRRAPPEPEEPAPAQEAAQPGGRSERPRPPRHAKPDQARPSSGRGGFRGAARGRGAGNPVPVAATGRRN